MTADRSKPDPKVVLLRRVFLIVLAFWAATPILSINQVAQDGTAFITGGRLARSDPGAAFAVRFLVRPDLYSPRDDPDAFARYSAAYCDTDPTGSCSSVTASYLSPPPALAVFAGLAAAGPRAGILAVRALAAAGMVAGAEVLWRLLRPSTEREALMLVVTAAAATPVAVNIIVLGQNTSLLFLAAALGVSRWRSPRAEAGIGALLAATIMLKLFPGFLLVVLALQKRWRLIGITLLMLAAWTVASSPFVPSTSWRYFIECFTIYREGADSHMYNLSTNALLLKVIGGQALPRSVELGSLLLRASLVVWMWITRVRHADEDMQWTYAWVALVMLNDYVWPHYFLLLLPAVAYIARARPALLPMLPASAAVTVVLVALWMTGVPAKAVTNLVALGSVIALPILAGPRRDGAVLVVPHG